MARFGSPFAAGFGSPENHLLRAKLRLRNNNAEATGAVYSGVPRAGLGDSFWGLYRSARWLRNTYLPEGEEFLRSVDAPWGADSISVLMLRLGHLADPSYEIERVARTFEESGNARVTLPITFVPKVAEPHIPGTIGANLSTWSFTGLDRDTHCRRVLSFQTRGELDVVVTTDGVNITISIQRDGYEICTATVATAYAGVIAFTASNSSGVTGVVTKAGAVTAGSTTLTVRWPKYMSILRDTVDPPAAEVAQLLYEGRNVVRWTEGDDLPSATYYYRIQPVSDTGDVGTVSASKSKTLDVAPAPPTNLAYAAGHAGYGTNLFTAPQDLSNGAWTKVSSFVVADNAIGPDGLMSADTFQDDGLGNDPYVWQSVAIVAGQTVQFWTILKNGPAPASTLVLLATDTNGVAFTDRSTYVDPSTGVYAGTNQCTAITAVDLGRGYFLIGIKYVATYTGNHKFYRKFGYQISNNVLIYRSQVEIGNTPHFPTVLSFTPSPTAGRTYRLYGTPTVGGEFCLNDIQATAPSGASRILLPAVAGSPGLTYWVLRAVSATGKEEKNLLLLALEYDSSAEFIAARPNTPGVIRASIAVALGRTLSLRAVYSPILESGVATKLQLFTRTLSGYYGGGGSDVYTAPDNEADLATSANGMKAANLTFALPTNGWYYIRVLAATAAGIQSDPTVAPELLVYVSDADMPAGTLGELELSRS